MRYREFVLSPYGVIKIKSLGYNAVKHEFMAKKVRSRGAKGQCWCRIVLKSCQKTDERQEGMCGIGREFERSLGILSHDA
ncbi:hypothetical protein [Symbiopectobacterium purcellii]|uniref:hypothetical protein n=1 Tax=Symbiopectobacterium purcellii TaxID=2871826 RepID=UPI003F87A65C